MRFREDDRRSSYTQTWRWTTPSAPNPVWNTKTVPDQMGGYKSISDVVTDNFTKRKNSGAVIINPLEVSSWTASTSHNGVLLQKNTAQGPHTGVLNGPYWGHGPFTARDLGLAFKSSVHDPQVQSLIALVSTEARARIGESGNTFLVSAGEMSSTLRYLRNPFSTGLKLAHALERRISKLGRAGASNAEIRKRSAEMLLEYKFGILPLVREVEAIFDEFTLKVDKGPRAASQRAFAKSSITSTRNESRDGSFSGVKCTLACRYEVQTEVSCGFYYSLLEQQIDALRTNRDLGMRLTDIPRAAWAVMPNSFIVDWLVNAGSFVSAMTPLPGLTIHGSWLTRYSSGKYDVSAHSWGLVSDPLWYGVGGGGTSSFITKDVSRTVPAPLPSLVLKVQTDQKPSLLSGGQAGTLLALWTARHKEIMSLFVNMQRR